jgi:hypothetical protein
MQAAIDSHLTKSLLSTLVSETIGEEHRSWQQISVFRQPGFSDEASKKLAVKSGDLPVHLLNLRLFRSRKLIEHEREKIGIPAVFYALVDPRSIRFNDFLAKGAIEHTWH